MMRPNNNKNNNNYFSQNIKEFGEDFLKYKNPRTIEIEAGRVFRDLAKNNVDINKYGKYFLDKDFIRLLIKEANKKYTYYNICCAGISTLTQVDMNASKDNDVLGTLESVNRSRQAYILLLNCFNTILNSGDFSHLYNLVTNLNQFRYDL